jgi:hypothetical protein
MGRRFLAASPGNLHAAGPSPHGNMANIGMAQTQPGSQATRQALPV